MGVCREGRMKDGERNTKTGEKGAGIIGQVTGDV